MCLWLNGRRLLVVNPKLPNLNRHGRWRAGRERTANVGSFVSRCGFLAPCTARKGLEGRYKLIKSWKRWLGVRRPLRVKTGLWKVGKLTPVRGVHLDGSCWPSERYKKKNHRNATDLEPKTTWIDWPKKKKNCSKKRKKKSFRGEECALEGQQTKITIPCLVSNGGSKCC